MFTLTRIFNIPNIRNLSKTFTKVDPGINKRKKILNSNEELEDTDLDDLESDFMNVHKSHRQHVDEMNIMLEKEKYHIVREKYFKKIYPNFLTWNDKEQIKYLHTTDPEEWTIGRLSEGFPALPSIIKKIVESKWTKNPTKIHNHDMAVQKNWEMFKNGQISDLPKELVEHLNKFTNRALNFTKFQIPSNKKVIEVHNKKGNCEFSEIITSYEKLKNKYKAEETSKDSYIELNTNTSKPGDTNTYLIDKKERKDKSPITLHQLKSKIENKANRGEKLLEGDKLVIKRLQEIPDQNLVKTEEDEVIKLTKNKYVTSEGAALIKKTERDVRHLIYPERIIVPKEIKKKGYSYKLNNCYYDDDGEFLYRVPGMG